MILNNDYNFNIDEIRDLTFEQAYIIGEQKTKIKEHDIIFCTLGEYFGFSALVFFNGKHIVYADEYELHALNKHKGNKPELLEYYIEKLNNKLFTDDEFSSVTDYNDYKRKEDYLRNHYAKREDYISMFFIGSDEEREKLRRKTETMTFNPVGFCYMDNTDFVKKHIELLNTLIDAWEKKADDFESLKSAYLYEMYNHEYPINWQGDYDVFSCFGNVPNYEYHIDKYFDFLKWNDTQRQAYMSARSECINNFDC